MQQFAYRASDRFGNMVDGNIMAADHASAILGIQKLGYTPIGIQVAGAVAAPAPVSVAAGRPGAVDLTQPVTVMPAAAVDIYAVSEPQPTLELTSTDVGLAAYAPPESVAADTTSADDRTTRMAHLEPWERVTPDAPSGSVERTVAMMPGGVERPRHRNQTIRGLEKIPFGANSSRVVGVGQRFRETIVLPLFSGVKLYDLAQWYRQLATLIGAGLNINQSLSALADNTKNLRLKEIAQNGALQVRAGGYFSDVMAAYPWVFPAMHLEMLRAAEHGGLMEDTLRQIGDYVEHEMEVRRLIARETLYPKIVLVVLVMLMGLSGICGEVPAIAKLILGAYSTSHYLMDTVGFALAILIPIFALVAFFRLFAFNSGSFRSTYDQIKINLPVLGKIIRNFSIAKFARTYSALSKAGFPSSSALQIAGDASGNVVMARAGQFAAVKAEQGAPPSQSLGQTAQFTHVTIDMLRTAELSGSVDEMMVKVADYHEADAKAATHTVCMIFSVFVLLVVGVVVGFTVIGQYTGYANNLKSAAGD